MRKKLSVALVAAECAPFFKIGGLADVVGSLPYALAKQEVNSCIILPKYGVPDACLDDLRKTKHQFTVQVDGRYFTVHIWQTELPDSSIPVYFLEQNDFFAQGNVYLQKLTAPASEYKRMRRFAFFTRAAAYAMRHLELQPDVVHLHDWHMGLLPLELRQLNHVHNTERKSKTVLTIHNVGYQGLYRMQEVASFLEWTPSERKEIAGYALKRGEVNFLNLAIRMSDMVTTVSPTHAKEICTKVYGYGLERILRKKGVTGILNGIATDVFNPRQDESISCRYGMASFAQGKKKNKKALQYVLGLDKNLQAPLIGLVGRLAYQKGIELFIANTDWLVPAGVHIVVLGSGLLAYEQSLKKLAVSYPKNIAVHIGFNAKLAKQIYASSDLFVMPSRYEPCGLGQMIAMRYGSVPVARKTGGLADTIRPYPARHANGFLFNTSSTQGLRRVLGEALQLYSDHPSIWKSLVRNGMQGDYSWNRSAKEYTKLYKNVTQGKM